MACVRGDGERILGMLGRRIAMPKEAGSRMTEVKEGITPKVPRLDDVQLATTLKVFYERHPPSVSCEVNISRVRATH